MSKQIEVLHRPEQGKFLIRLAPGVYAFLGYELRENKMYITTTYTPPEHRGQGLATRLVEHAVAWAKEQGYKVVPVCSFAVNFFKKNRELISLVDEDALKAIE
ncbi:MAG: N-acetyltransferase [Thermofilaceae archaeon]|nr:N-acetyltransferase [Thermofilaceae archaeon]MCX8181054.1 N-acetyltransferase [Thermofilaceae archaeon]MDW8004535.1 GNAT family N-acetyltransferase [Thermofilaceae archaeon]